MSKKRKPRKEKPVKLRCFLGLGFPLAEALSPLIDRLGQFAADPSNKLRLIAPENLHVTLKFLGAVEPQRLGVITELATDLCRQQGPLTIDCRGLGFFKQSLWVGIAENLQLQTLAQELDAGCKRLGLKNDAQAFAPHVTVARFSKQAKLELSPAVAEFFDKQWGEYRADEVNLYRSDTLPEGAKYTIIKSYDLGPPAEIAKSEETEMREEAGALEATAGTIKDSATKEP